MQLLMEYSTEFAKDLGSGFFSRDRWNISHLSHVRVKMGSSSVAKCRVAAAEAARYGRADGRPDVRRDDARR